MEAPAFLRGGRGRGGIVHDGIGGRGRPHSRNKHWSSQDGGSRSHTPNNVDNERWERGGHRGGGRGRGHSRGAAPKFHNVSLRLNNTRHHVPAPEVPSRLEQPQEDGDDGDTLADIDQDMDSEDDGSGHLIQEPELDSQEERDKFYQELVKARETERKKAIAEGKMDDPLIPKRLEDAITIVGTCMDMCPRFERYRRERENGLFEWEMIPGTKRVDHTRAVKMYERGAGDRILPSDLRPPKVLKRTLDYLFHDLLSHGGFSSTFNFIRDRSRAVRNDFTMQHITGPLAIECHDRCARFHILALHLQRDLPGFSIHLEEQQLMNTLQSLKEFYEDQRGRYQSPNELEMRVYHRLIHIRDQKERHDDIPEHIYSHPVFQLTTDFRQHVQSHSAPISKTSKLIVTEGAMHIFAHLAAVLSRQGSMVMVYLVACILERLFGTDTIEDIESLKGDLTIPEIVDGVSTSSHIAEVDGHESQLTQENGEDEFDDPEVVVVDEVPTQPLAPTPLKPNDTDWLEGEVPQKLSPHNSTIPSSAGAPTGNAFSGLVSQPNVFGTTNVFGNSVFTVPSSSESPFGNSTASTPNIFGDRTFPINTLAPIQPEPTFPSVIAGSAPEFTPSPAFFPSQSDGSSSASLPGVGHFGVVVSNAREAPDMPGNDPPWETGTAANGACLSSRPSSSIPAPLNPNAVEFIAAKNSTQFVVSQPPAPLPALVGAVPSSPIETQSPVTNPLTIQTTHLTSPIITKQDSRSSTSSASLNRPSAPPLPRINTSTSISSSSTRSTASPSIPPPAPRVQPISLPATPSVQGRFPLLDHLRNSLEPRGLFSVSDGQEVLSPLVIGTPTTSAKLLHYFTPFLTPQTSKIFKTSSPFRTNGKGKATDRTMYDDVEVVEEMKKKAHAFAQKSLLVKETFARWLKRAMDRATWHEACRQGDEYRQKVADENRHSSVLRLSSSRPEPPSEKKRRVSNGVEVLPLRKRVRKKLTEYRPPRTDEELAKRFKENQQEHEQRWAPGSFLGVIKQHIQSINPSTLELPWDTWLSLNPECDATAIWLERKFDMPGSGTWFSEYVFSIPLSPSGVSNRRGYPGLIVFECTPIGDVADDLEKKYRVLDDCSRLRVVIESLPPKRHFVPTIVFIDWAEQESEPSIAPDILTMAKHLVSESVVKAYHVFAMTATSKDLDNKLRAILMSLPIDTQGKLVQSLELRGFFKTLEPVFLTFLDEWMENCNRNGRIDWGLYGEVIKASIATFNINSALTHHVLKTSNPPEPLPPFNSVELSDTESAYDSVMEWLSGLSSRDLARTIAMDIQSHRNIGQEFPIRVFIDRLWELTQARFEHRSPESSRLRPVVTSDLNLAIESYKEEIQAHHLKLLQIYNFNVRRSPKRRPYSAASSEQGSPQAKRPRLSASLASSVNGDYQTPMLFTNGEPATSPTPSIVSLAPTEGPTVTVAMLRTLTKDLRNKYVAKS